MRDWHRSNFGAALCDLFFDPFNERYTAGLYSKIAMQDVYKSPLARSSLGGNASALNGPVGYNVSYKYPRDGLGALSLAMASRCKIHFQKRVISIDPLGKRLFFEDGKSVRYKRLISTIPLNVMMQLSQLSLPIDAAPYTSVLILNIGAIKGQKCSDYHWLYTPDSEAGFHRVGFYSNVDRDFAPNPTHSNYSTVSLYVERAFAGGSRLSPQDEENYANRVITELRSWGWIKDVEVIDPSWVNVAYTWDWPGYQWRSAALELLKSKDIWMAGRFACWKFQGIGASIQEGMRVGKLLRV